MSITEAIRDLHAAEKLFPYHPEGTRKLAKRCVFLTREAAEKFNDPQSAVNLLCARGPIAAALTRWVVGGLVYGEQTRGRFLVMLHPPPPDIWEIRVTEPVVQARLLGRFAAPDVLVLMRLHTRSHLGDKGSAEWNEAMADCVRQWDQLFPGVPPFSGSSIHQYVTENCDDFPLLKPCTPKGARPRRVRRR